MSTFALGPDAAQTVRVRATQLAGPYSVGPPPDRASAIGMLRAAAAAGVDHIDTAQYYGPSVVNDLIREALYPYPDGLAIAAGQAQVHRGEPVAGRRALRRSAGRDDGGPRRGPDRRVGSPPAAHRGPARCPDRRPARAQSPAAATCTRPGLGVQTHAGERLDRAERLADATKQVRGHHQILVIRRTGTAPDGTGPRRRVHESAAEPGSARG